ncbi:rho GTPase-activating protein 44-like protein [Dinothrombium tinctorium]|uniref:Rho GTPase-activating protein 44-like protein n=1 Tax=Dinothrombium tinctorium TaxID=1965070 RepID=A0A3S3S7B0_9ACAR|nr:rho GTPase-activating protein 44-like protein [Dinothrombium tinctorium]
MKKQLLNIKHFVQDINLTTRGEKNDVLTTDLLNAEKKVEIIKQSCQSTEKKISACLQGVGLGTDTLSIEKRQKKMPEIQLYLCFQELGEQLGFDSVLGQTLTTCGDISKMIGQEMTNYELEVERQCLSQLNSLLENDIPNVYKVRKQLNKATQDRDNYRQRFQTAMKQQTHQSGTTATVAAANKVAQLKKELEESNTRVEQAKDAFAVELLSFLSREPELSQIYLQFFKLKASFYSKIAEILTNSIPQLEEIISDTAQKPCFGTSLDEHLRVTDKEISVVIETCIGWLLNNLNEEGLFRIPGSTSKVKKLRSSFDAGVIDVDEYARDPHTVAGCLKSYLRELPEPLLTHQLYDEWIEAAKISDSNSRLQALWQVTQKLPKSNYANLKYTIKFLAKLTQNSNANKMSSQNIAIAMAPSLVWAPNVDGDENTFGLNMTAANLHSIIVDSLVTYADWFFPEEVEFTTLPIFRALLNGESDDVQNTPVAMPRTTAPRTSKKPAPPAPPSAEKVDKNLERKGSLLNEVVTATLPRNGNRILKPDRPSIKEKSHPSSHDQTLTLTNCVSYSTGSLDRKHLRNGEETNTDKKKRNSTSGSKSNRNSVEKPSVPPPSVPITNVQSIKSERPSSLIERPSVPPPERPQRSSDFSRTKGPSTENIDSISQENCASNLYPDLNTLQKVATCEKMKRDSTETNSDKDSITFVDESDDEILSKAQNRKFNELIPEKPRRSLPNDDSCDQLEEENSISDVTPDQRTSSRVKPPRPQPPVMKSKFSNENTYL